MSLLSLQNISKEFPGVRALSDVSIDLHTEEIHALVGENGAGKSTLIKILGGVYPAGTYSGKIIIDGKTVRFQDVRDSENAQVRVIHQELSLVNEMTVAENIFLGDEPLTSGLIDYTEMEKKACGILNRLNCTVSANERIGNLSIGEQQLVEIAKALSQNARILVLDEPTAALPEKDVRNLLDLIIHLKEQGLGIIYISHKLNEVAQIADMVTVLRNGENISTFNRGGYTHDDLVRDMLGRSIGSVFPEFTPASNKELIRFSHVDLPCPGRTDKKILEDISFTCHEGEVLGIAGLMGAGRTALLSLLFGIFSDRYTGEIIYRKRPFNPLSPVNTMKNGIALVAEDRKRYGVIDTSDVQGNMAISSLDQFRSRCILDLDAVSVKCSRFIEKLSVKTPGLDFPMNNLSGGNQQKVILGRLMMTEPRLLLMDDPTRGVDIGAKQEIYHLIQKLAAEGLGILFVSSELPEVLGVSHRVIVLHNGSIRAEFNRGEKSEKEVLALSAGV